MRHKLFWKECIDAGASLQRRIISQMSSVERSAPYLLLAKQLKELWLFLGCFEGFQRQEGQQGLLFALH